MINMHIEKINKYLDNGGVAIIPGFQGISKNGDVTTIGRGGSDATAVAIAKIFNADYCEIYTDVDGVLTDVLKLDNRLTAVITSRLKVLSNLKLNISNVPQNGRFSILRNNEKIDIRTSVLPGPFGESISLRILNANIIPLNLKELGLNEKHLKTALQELHRPNGLILVTGPTGSGKTTTLYAAIKELHTPEVKIITLEDPIEYQLAGIVQTQINRKGDYTFALGLKNILRQDPDIILIGEIRDAEAGSTALNASLTGHMVLSTLHTNDAIGAIPRLIDIGIKPEVIAPALNLIIAQRLVRKICQNCQGKKCLKCHKTGYRGRIGIFELLQVDDDIQKLILSDTAPSTIDIKKMVLKKGFKPMREDGLAKVKAGITSQSEVDRVAPL